MNQPTQHRLEAALLSSMWSTAGKLLPDLIGDLAKKGQIDCLETIMVHRLAPLEEWGEAELAWEKGRTFRLSFAYAIIPLISSVSGHDQARAEKLVRDWITWCGAAEPTHIARHLQTLDDRDTAARLIELGGPSVDHDGSLSRRVRDLVQKQEMPDLASTIVTSAAAVGCYSPLFVATGALAWLGWHNADVRTANAIDKITLPPSAPRQPGGDILAALEYQKNALDDCAYFQQFGYLDVWLTILDKTDMQAEDWRRLANAWSASKHIFNTLCRSPAVGQRAARVIRGFASAGVDVTQLLADIPGKRDPVPLIHRAILENNAPLVQALLDLGADPAQTVKIKGKEKPGESLAPPGSETAQLLNARRAQQAMRAVANTAALAAANPLGR